MILVVDNRDSFTFNVVQALQALGAEVTVRSSRGLDPGAVLAAGPEGVLLGPGPGRPETAGATLAVLEACTGRVPVLGLCLGHQALAVAGGGRLVRARQLVHGRTVEVRHDGRGTFTGLPSPTPFAVYNSLVVEETTLPAWLAVSARSGDGEVMGLRHRSAPVEGVQFHPESFLSPVGEGLLANWLSECRRRSAPGGPRGDVARARPG